jgi:hypothetical protein
MMLWIGSLKLLMEKVLVNYSKVLVFNRRNLQLKLPNKRVHSERRQTRSFMMQSESPSGKLKAVMPQYFVGKSSIFNTEETSSAKCVIIKEVSSSCHNLILHAI